MSVIALKKCRDLTLEEASSNSRPAYVSAASGLVCVQSFLYVIADDELHLGVFRRDTTAPGALIRLLPGELPANHQDRKKQKPDFESLTWLPPFDGFPHGALLASGSGSRPNRRRGALIGLGAEGHVVGSPQAVDLSPIFAPLENLFPDLNIEGAIVAGEKIWLFQRGNKGHRGNAIVDFPLAAFLTAIQTQGHHAVSPLARHAVDLGMMDGVPFSFTDAAPLPNGDMVFSAVAEDTSDSYSDGVCMGSAIGMVGAVGTRHWLHRVAQRCKIEGVHASRDGDVLHLLLVTDADDINIAASLYAAELDARSGLSI